MKFTESKYGSFDVVLALGFLYHLEILSSSMQICLTMRRLILIDTHVALWIAGISWKRGLEAGLSPLRSLSREENLRGSRYREYIQEKLSGQISSTTASLKNDLSVWLTEDH